MINEIHLDRQAVINRIDADGWQNFLDFLSARRPELELFKVKTAFYHEGGNTTTAKGVYGDLKVCLGVAPSGWSSTD